MADGDTKYFRQTIEIEILSTEVPFEWDNLEDIKIALDNGTVQGRLTETWKEQLSPKAYRLACIRANTEEG